MWKSRIVLEADESLRFESAGTEGFMQETDVEKYSVVRTNGEVTGTVKVTDHTAVKGFKRTIHVVHRDFAGTVILDIVI